jgi:hypothetical protein
VRNDVGQLASYLSLELMAMLALKISSIGRLAILPQNKIYRNRIVVSVVDVFWKDPMALLICM